MYSVNAPIATSFSLSFLLHSAVFAALLLAYGQVTTSGEGIEIELVRSTMIADQLETEVPRKRDAQSAQIDNSEQPTEKRLQMRQRQITQQQQLASSEVLTSRNSSALVAAPKHVNRDMTVERQPPASDRPQQKVADKGESQAVQQRSTNAVQQQLSILALLHDSISNHKEYPYLARRQQREGVATVGFILHPDGSIEDAHLVTSSNADTLDRAALSAVKRIEPFIPAQDYLDRAEAFKIDVVFNLR